MPSSAEQKASGTAARGSMAKVLISWNRKLHYYLGLYMLLFLWLFLFTGLLLNHPEWAFAEFWPNRKQSTVSREIQTPSQAGDLAKAREIMRQLGVHGEVDWTNTQPGSGSLNFRASRPGNVFEIQADLDRNRAQVRRIELNAWGVARILHTFTGVRMADKANERDWVMTTIWAYTMDALALGLILMIFSSLYMWWSQPRKRRLGLFALGSGVLTCGCFVIGLRWFA